MELQLFQAQNQIAEIFYKAGTFNDVKSVAQAFVKIQAGRELGIEPFQAMNSFDIIQGKVAIKPVALAGLLKKSGKYDYRIVESDNNICEIEFLQDNKTIGLESFSIKDASLMGLTARDQWKKQPKNMLVWRCMAFGIRHFCPDVMMGAIYDTEEVKDFTEFKEVKEPVKELISVDDTNAIIEWKCCINNCLAMEELERIALQMKDIPNEVIKSNIRPIYKQKQKELANANL